jgi:hypothetical protein
MSGRFQERAVDLVVSDKPVALTREEQIDLTLLRAIAELENLRRHLSERDFARVPSLLELIHTAERVAHEIGYGQ